MTWSIQRTAVLATSFPGLSHETCNSDRLAELWLRNRSYVFAALSY
jgi:hypothetical protein